MWAMGHALLTTKKKARGGLLGQHVALRCHQTHFPDWGVMRRWGAPLHTSGAGCVAGVDTDRAVCLKHAICVPECALSPGSRALTVSHLKRVITASRLPGSGLRSRWQAAGSVVLAGGWPPVSSSPGTSEGPYGWGSWETSGEPGLERVQKHPTGGP